MNLAIYPAIDLKGGRCVRLLKGDMASATIYADDPAAQAEAFASAGFTKLHIVDLDGAVQGESVNGAAVEAIVSRTKLSCQLGGGVRDRAAIERWLARGLARVILGTAAVKNPGLVREAARAFPGQIAVGLDAIAGRLRTDGWIGESGADALGAARSFEDAGVAALIHTDISRDGALGGPNIEATAALADAVSIPVIASGGVASAADIAALGRAHANIEGVIVGRAFYEKRITPAEALAAAKR